jgi:hypothetical protein
MAYPAYYYYYCGTPLVLHPRYRMHERTAVPGSHHVLCTWPRLPALRRLSGHDLTFVSLAGQPGGSSTQDAPHNIVSKHQDPLRLTSPRRPMQVYLMFAFDAAT